MSIVSNSSPLIVYAKSGLLDLLPAIFGQVWIPPAVDQEVVAEGRGRPGAAEIAAADWIVRTATPEPMPFSDILVQLDPGEAEAIALAWQERARMGVLLADGRARRVAAALGLQLLGSGGVLIEARRAGLLTEVRSALGRLLGAGLYLSVVAQEQVLSAAGQ
jgi:predicted nucleic acid-binding protein